LSATKISRFSGRYSWRGGVYFDDKEIVSWILFPRVRREVRTKKFMVHTYSTHALY